MIKTNIFYQDQRLIILQTLRDFSYNANESILDDVLLKYGHSVSRALVKNHMLFLEEQGLVKIDDLNGFFVATLTQRGLDVANGEAKIAGVKRPNLD